MSTGGPSGRKMHPSRTLRWVNPGTLPVRKRKLCMAHHLLITPVR